MVNNSRIVIIGAGVSGIFAAVRLVQNGYRNISILEANERIGGRINSVTFGSTGSKIDLGAQWVSGKNDVYETMKNHFKFGDTMILPENQFFLSSSDEVDKVKCDRLQSLGEEIMFNVEELEKSSETYGGYFTRKYSAALETPEYEDIEKHLSDKMLRFMQTEFNSLYSTSNWNQVPARLVADSTFVEGSQFMSWKKEGYVTLLDYLIEQLDETHNVNLEDKIIMNKKVVNINYNSEEVKIKCMDGSELSANHVISTIPLGYLKVHHGSLFTPALPAAKVKAIDAIGVGVLGKVFLEFEDKILPAGARHCICLWSESDLNEIQGTDKEWLLQCYGFMRVDCQDHLIEALFAGDKMWEFETYDDQKIISDCLWLLEKFLKESLNPPINMARSKWLTNENFLGVYSYPSLKCDSSSTQRLGQPILNEQGKPVVLFGGEATSKDFQGYVHGAMQSGRRVAQEVIDFYLA